MKAAWLIFVLICAVTNGMTDTWNWWHDPPATGFTWLFAIWFSVTVALNVIGDLLEHFR